MGDATDPTTPSEIRQNFRTEHLYGMHDNEHCLWRFRAGCSVFARRVLRGAVAARSPRPDTAPTLTEFQCPRGPASIIA